MEDGPWSMVSKGNEASMRGRGGGGWASPCVESTSGRDSDFIPRAVGNVEGL